MKEVIKKILPKSLLPVIWELSAFVKKPSDLFLIKIQPRRHKKFLKNLRAKNKVKVAFFVLNADIWKFEELLTLLESDERFEPVVVVCPPMNLRDEGVRTKMDEAYKFFRQKGHEVIYSLNEEEDNYVDVKKELSPDIIFFTNPYGYTLKKYRIKNFLDVLTCYAQYSFILEERKHFFNKTFHNLLWKAFYETEIHKKLAMKYATNNGANVEVTGYAGVDSFVHAERVDNGAWKNQDNSLKRIIWAPHWSITERGLGRPAASNFLKLSEFMPNLAESYRDQVQIAFKPHPYLKNALYHHPDWGKDRAESYYKHWDEIDNGQLETGNYADLFNSSDAMIFDSISFIAEYLFTGKPSMFTKASPDVAVRFSKLGKSALEHHYHGNSHEDIIRFIDEIIIEGKDIMRDKRMRFYRDTLASPNGRSASKNIYDILSKELFTHAET